MVAESCLKFGANDVRILTNPDGVKEGWDAADAVDEGMDVKSFILGHEAFHPVESRLSFKSASDYEGEPTPSEWLVQGSIPLGSPGMIAAMGDTGKSFLLLDLCARVALGEHPADSLIFGGNVCQRGTAVYITSEDPDNEIHRRLNAIDPDLSRIRQCGDKLLVLPLPDRGGAAPLVEQTARGIKPTSYWDELKDRLLAIGDLKLVVLDPLQSFCLADINADPAAGQYFCSMVTSLASETGATILVAHHMRKAQAKTDNRELEPDEARQLIRGTTALVDGMRFVYALWKPVSIKSAQTVCRNLGRTYEPDCMVYGGVVKANGKAPRGVATYLRSPSGLLIDQSQRLKDIRPYDDADLDSLVMCIAEAAENGHPFSRTGLNGSYKRKEDIPEPFRCLVRSSIDSVIDALVVEGRIVTCNAGGKIKNVLDVPSGDFAQGVGSFEPGTYKATMAQSA